ncbi:MAG: tRNA (N(6)-L-threonylcarbamoyladenosine(37)-C(2))-methylthiotransferase [Promethearchaeota archaeon]
MVTTFYLETYGCSLNAADSDIIVGRLHDIGFRRIAQADGASIVVLNSCGVKEPTEDRIIHRLEFLTKADVPVIVTGCLPRISLRRIQGAIPNFAAILGPQSIDSLGEITTRVLQGERGIVHLDSDTTSKLKFYEGPPSSVICTVPICEGCLGNCSYCAVKFARGKVQSYTIDEIRRVVERCVHLGYREIRLTSQDAGVFGHDTGESLPNLLQSLSTIEGNHRFRLGMLNPNLVLESIDDLLKAMTSDRFFKFFHVPLQAGSNSVLQRMRREYTVEQWHGIVKAIRSATPNATVATDIIVGFPGESDANFDETLRIIDKVRPDVVNISKYGDRPGTSASKSKEKTNTSIKKARSRRLSTMVSNMVKEINRSWIGWSGVVVATEAGSKGGTICRNYTYKPIILDEQIKPGTDVCVEIVAAERTHLVAERCRD